MTSNELLIKYRSIKEPFSTPHLKYTEKKERKKETIRQCV